VTSIPWHALDFTHVPAFETLLDQALKLPDEQRGELAARFLRNLESNDGDELSGQDWDAAWSAELDHRLREIRDGRVELADGDQVLAELRDIAEGPREEIPLPSRSADRSPIVYRERPEAWPTWYRADLRRRVLHKYPYSMFYVLEDGAIVIVAIAHHKRRPGYWLPRSHR
jgi:hypothetical protein